MVLQHKWEEPRLTSEEPNRSLTLTLLKSIARSGFEAAMTRNPRKAATGHLKTKSVSILYKKENLVDVSDIFYFFCSGRGKG